MLSISIVNMYAEGFESLVKSPKKIYKVKAQPAKNEGATVKNEEAKTSAGKPQINYFAGLHCVFNPLVK